MNLWDRLDNYERQNQSPYLTPAQDRRRIIKQRHQTGTDGGTWIIGAKNRPTPRRSQARTSRFATGNEARSS